MIGMTTPHVLLTNHPVWIWTVFSTQQDQSARRLVPRTSHVASNIKKSVGASTSSCASAAVDCEPNKSSCAILEIDTTDESDDETQSKQESTPELTGSSPSHESRPDPELRPIGSRAEDGSTG
jgi:hypothetical protein